MTARDEAITAIIRTFGDSNDDIYEAIEATLAAAGFLPLFEHVIEAIPADVLGRLAIERDAFAPVDVWDAAPSDKDRVTVYYEDELRPDDAVPLYRLSEVTR